MATIINTPGTTESNSGNGVIVGVLMVVFLAILFLIFGLPYLRQGANPAPAGGGASINVDLPSGGANGGAGAGGQ
jgi:hypothetical protein